MSEYSETSIVVGATFPDYASFENVFKRYCEITGYVFAKDGKTVESANRKIQNPALHFKPKFKYQIVTFSCKHFGEYTSKGKGIRKTQMSYKIGCKASLRLSADRQKDCLEIRHFESAHSHPIASGIGHVYPEVRRLNAEQSEQVKNLLDMQVPITSIQRVIGQKHGLKMLSHDIHNLRDKKRKIMQNTRTDGEMLHDSLQALLQNDPGCTVSVLEDRDAISVIFLQTTAMKRMLNAYGTMIFVDSTHCVNRYGMQLYVFVVADGNRQSQIVGYGIVKDERAVTLRSLFSEFEKHSNLLGKVKVVMVDKDLNEISKILEVYPHVKIMLCRFHVLKAFWTGSADNCDKEHREQIRGLIETMVYSASEEEYNDALDEISNVSPEFIDYFQRSWSNCIDSWAGFRLKDVPHSGHYTNNIVESHNQKIKAVIKRNANATLPELITGLLDIQACKGIADQQKVSAMVLKTPSVAPGISAITRAAMQQISGVTTNVVAVKLMEQLEKMKNYHYSVGSGEGDTIAIKSRDKNYIVSNDLMRCTCLFFVQFSLPCSHIFFARREQGQPVFLEEMVPQDAKKSVLLAAIHSGENVSQSHGAFLTHTNTESHAVPEASKFHVAMEELKILASSMVKCNHSRFEARVQQVRQLHSLWWSGKDVLITGVSSAHVHSSSASPTSVSLSIPPTGCSTSSAPVKQVVSDPSPFEPVVCMSLANEVIIPPTDVRDVFWSSSVAGPSSPIQVPVMSSSKPVHSCSVSVSSSVVCTSQSSNSDVLYGAPLRK